MFHIRQSLDCLTCLAAVAGAFGMVRAALEVGADLSAVPASSMRAMQVTVLHVLF